MVTDSSHHENTPSPRENTRDNVFDAILRGGPLSAAEIGKSLGLTAAAVRRHLDVLEDDGLIKIADHLSHRGAGRPSRQYVITSQGQSQLSNDYSDVSVMAMETIEKLGGEDAVREFARKYFEDVATTFNQRVENDATLQQRISVLVEVLTDFGFAATTRRAGRVGKVTTLRAAQICQGHCPIQGLATHYPQFCTEEADMFARLLKVDVRRLATMPTGGHVCNTHVPLGRQAHASLLSRQAKA